MARSAPYVDPMIPDAREERLPVWATAALKRLRRRVEDAERRADEARLSGGPEDTDTVLDPDDNTPIRLPKGSTVRFLLGDAPEGRVPREYVDVRVATGTPAHLYVNGGAGLLLHPQASNVIHITVGG